jgi:hypothetical protein
MTAWLKTFHQGNSLSPQPSPGHRPAVGGAFVLYEPLRRQSDGTPKVTQRGEPDGRPSWKPGELVAGYWNGTYRVAELWQIAGAPARCELEHWSWQTPVVLRHVREPGVGIDELAIKPMSLARATRLRLTADQEKRLRAFFEL